MAIYLHDLRHTTHIVMPAHNSTLLQKERRGLPISVLSFFLIKAGRKISHMEGMVGYSTNQGEIS